MESRLKELEEKYKKEKEETDLLFEKQRKEYESKITTLEEEVMRASMMSSITPDDYEYDEDDLYGESIGNFWLI